MSDTPCGAAARRHCRCVRPVRAHRTPRWPHHVRTRDIDALHDFYVTSKPTSLSSHTLRRPPRECAPPPMTLRYGERPEPATSALRVRSRLALRTRSSLTPRSALIYSTHCAACVDSLAVRAAGACEDLLRPTRPRARSASTIDPKHARKRRHHPPRAARPACFARRGYVHYPTRSND